MTNLEINGFQVNLLNSLLEGYREEVVEDKNNGFKPGSFITKEFYLNYIDELLMKINLKDVK